MPMLTALGSLFGDAWSLLVSSPLQAPLKLGCVLMMEFAIMTIYGPFLFNLFANNAFPQCFAIHIRVERGRHGMGSKHILVYPYVHRPSYI